MKLKNNKKNNLLIVIGSAIACAVIVFTVLTVLNPRITPLNMYPNGAPTSRLPFIRYRDVLRQTDDTYLVYFWNEACPFCTQFEPDLLNAWENHNMPIYVIDVTLAANTGALQSAQGTPAIWVIQRCEVIATGIGVPDSVSLLEQFSFLER